MIPGWTSMFVLVFAAYRLTRLAGWDTFILARRLREWAWDLPEDGKPPRRGWAYELTSCPFCLGWWISLGLYLLWLTAPTVTMYGSMPLAISGVVGLVAKNLDP